MIIKNRDSRDKDIKELMELLSCNLTVKQRFFIEREIKAIKKGACGEDDSAYYLDFYFADSPRWVLIHDLRIELDGKVAQIDHILINRAFEIFILESKNYGYGIKITANGEFEAIYGKQYIGIPSPLEQNQRHIYLLSKLIERHDLLPRKLSIPIKARFLNYVLISPKAIIKRPSQKRFDSSNVIKADTLRSVIDKRADELGNIEALSLMAKLSSLSTVEKFGRKLIAFHRPASTDWKKRFGIVEENCVESSPKQRTTSRYYCARCRAGISDKEAKFCWNNKSRFGGKAFCYECQKLFQP